MEELSDLVKTLITKQIAGSSFSVPATKDDRDKFMLKVEKIKNEELLKKIKTGDEVKAEQYKLNDPVNAENHALLIAQTEENKKLSKQLKKFIKAQENLKAVEMRGKSETN
jgi:Cu/Ag efflux protein CusF